MDRFQLASTVGLTHAAAKVGQLLSEVIPHTGLSVAYTVETRPEPAPRLLVCFEGPDVRHLLARNAELLLALEHLAAKALRLEPEEHDLIGFDAGNFKAAREHALERAALRAVREVSQTGRPYHFPPMNSRERRLLHLALTPSGLTTQSEGEGPVRHLVVHPRR